MWRAVTENWQIKLTAVVLAWLVWLYANSVVIKTTDVELLLEVSHPDPLSVSVPLEQSRVTVTLSGPAGVINDLSRRQFQLSYRVTDTPDMLDQVVKRVTYEPGMIANLPAGVSASGFNPAVFELTVRRLAEATFAVNPPATTGAPAKGYEVAWTRIRGRNEVPVRGPVRVLERIRNEKGGAVDTVPIDVTNRSEPFSNRFTLIRSEVTFDDGTIETISPEDQVEVYVEIKRVDVKAVIKGVPVTLLVPPGFTHEVVIETLTPVDLNVEGPRDVVGTLAADALIAFIDVRGRKPETEKEDPFTEKLIVMGLPPGVHLSDDVHIKARFKLPKAATPAGGLAP